MAARTAFGGCGRGRPPRRGKGARRRARAARPGARVERGRHPDRDRLARSEPLAHPSAGGEAMSHRYRRTQRVEELLKQEIARIVREEVKDPRVGFATVMRVAVSPDL